MTMSEQQNANNILVDISNPLKIRQKVFNTELIQGSIIDKKISDFYNIITKSIRQETNASTWLGVIPSQDTNLLFSLAALAVTPYLPCNLATSPLK